jgi:hypothetical protein
MRLKDERNDDGKKAKGETRGFWVMTPLQQVELA